MISMWTRSLRHTTKRRFYIKYTVWKEREKLQQHALLFNNSTPSLYVKVHCVQNWVENGFAEPVEREKWIKGT